MGQQWAHSPSGSSTLPPNTPETCEIKLCDDKNNEKNPRENDHLPPLPPSPLDLESSTEQYDSDVGCPTSKRVRRLFRRHSSIKVCPEEDGCEVLKTGENSNPSTPSPLFDSSKHSFLLFSGTFLPVTFRENADVRDGFLSPMQLYNSMNDGQLSTHSYDPSFMLLLDTRSLVDYQNLHISTAVHISELNSKNKTQPLESYTLIVLYDHKGLSRSLPQSAMSKTLSLVQAQGIEPFILAGGFDNFHNLHPYLCSSKASKTFNERKILLCDYPSIVIEDSLYLGRADQATNPRIKKNLGLTHIINVTRDHPNAFSDEVKYLVVEVDDDSSADLLHQFPALIHFIRTAVEQSGRILVHCNLGRSRSSTVVIAYLMFAHKWSLQDAYFYLKDRRPIIHPNRNFLSQLSKFEEILFGKKLSNVEHVRKG